MAFPTSSVLTNFTQADGALPGTWTNDIVGSGVGQVAVASNQLAVNTFGRTAWWNGSTFGPDTEVFCTVATKPADGAGWLQLWARVQTPGSSAADGYKIELGPAGGTDSVDVYRVINGVDTSIGSVSQEFTAGDRLGAEITGTGATVSIQIYRHNGTSWSAVGSPITDSNAARIVSAGYIGVGGYQTANTMRIDDFGGGTLSGGGVAPANTVAPAVTGTPTVGQVLSCSTGTWTGDATIVYTYQWQADTLGNGTFANIGGATSSTYTLQAGEEGDDVRCVVTGTNGSGNASANSNEVGPVAAATGDENCYVMTAGGLVPSVSRVMTASGLFPPV